MAYVAPTTRSDGYVVPASVWNQDVCANVIALKALTDGIPSVSALCQGRLSLTTAVPVTTSDVTAAGTLYWVPYQGNTVGLYSGSAWVAFNQAELSIAVPAAANQVYDVFIDYNSGTPALSLTAWTNDTTRATALTTQDGVLVLTGSTGKRYVGTVRTVTASQLNDSVLLRHVWNYYNRVGRPLLRQESTGSWAYTTATIRQANASTSNQVDIVVGVAEDAISLTLNILATNATNNANFTAGIGEDSTTTFSSSSIGNAGYLGAAAQTYIPLTYALVKIPAVGRHYYSWNEFSAATGTTTWYGATISGGSGGSPSGLTGVIRG